MQFSALIPRIRRFDSRSLSILGLTACQLALVGCGEGDRQESFKTTVSARAPAALARAAPSSPPAGAMGGGMGGAMAAGDKTSSFNPASNAATDAKVPPALPRKIIYNAKVTVVVESVAALSDQLAKLVKEAGGYVSETDQSSYTHVQRTASWTIRVPVDRFDGFLAAVNRLGEVQQSRLDSQDVTQEFYDIEARIKNKQEEEKRLLKHLADSTGKLDEILAVERELSRVRGEIETMQGRIRFLASSSDLSTLTITATEVESFTPLVHPTFGTEIARTFSHSVEGLVDFGKGIILATVSIAPWLPLVVLVALLMVVVGRGLVRRGRVVLTQVRPESR